MNKTLPLRTRRKLGVVLSALFIVGSPCLAQQPQAQPRQGSPAGGLGGDANFIVRGRLVKQAEAGGYIVAGPSSLRTVPNSAKRTR
jgi:hypothetical protein